jgi:sugar (pentulose or hexulose) kinase
MSDRTTWVGLDLGTQSVRALAVSSSGEILASASRPLRSVREGSRHEQDPRSWWAASEDALREMVGRIDRRRIRGLSVCSTSGTVVLTDSSGTPVTPGIMYDDARAAERPAILDAILTKGADLWHRLGHRPQASWALPTLVYLHETGAWPAGAHVCHQGDYIMQQLAGHTLPTDSGQALKTGVDLATLLWPEDLFARLGLDPGRFPDVVLPGTRIGAVSADAAERTGLPAGTPLFAGTTDGCAAQFASGAVRPGDWNSVLGTTLVIKGVSSTLVHEPTGAVYSHRAPYRDYWLPGGASSTGAGLVAAMFTDPELRDAGRCLPTWSEVPVCYPLAGVGERFPFLATDAVGLVATDDTLVPAPQLRRLFDAPTALAAVMLGVACLERLCYDLLDLAGAPPAGTVRLTGGATRNTTWNQLRCDMLGVPVELPASTEPALGSAMLAASSGSDLPDAARRMVRVTTSLTPTAREDGPAIGYQRFLDLLLRQGWISEPLAGHSRRRNAR